MWGRKSSGKPKDQPKDDKKKGSAKASAPSKGAKEEKREVRFKEAASKRAGNQPGQPKQAKSRNKVQSAHMGNSQGVKSTKLDPFVNFGPELKAFFSSSHLADRSVAYSYEETTDESIIKLTFRRVVGISLWKSETMSLEEYMANKKELLKIGAIKDDRYLSWCTRLLVRLSIDLTSAPPRVDPASVKNYVQKHLSPIENTVLQLSQDEWDQVDTNKLKQILEPTDALIANYYAPNGRTAFFVEQLTVESPPQKDPPEWAAHGFLPCSKGTLLSHVKVKRDDLSPDSAQAIEHLGAMLYGAGMDTGKLSSQVEDEKN